MPCRGTIELEDLALVRSEVKSGLMGRLGKRSSTMPAQRPMPPVDILSRLGLSVVTLAPWRWQHSTILVYEHRFDRYR